MYRFVLALWIVLLMAGTAWAGDTVKEEETGLAFKKELSGGLALIATGVREKLGFDVYAAGAYVHKSYLPKLKEAKSPASKMIFGSFHRRLVLQFVRNAPADKIQAAFRGNLEKHMTAEERPKAKDDIERFMRSMDPGIKKGQTFIFDAKGSRATVLLNGKKVFETENLIMLRTMWKVYFASKNPISKTLYDNFVKGAASGPTP